jgi:hypothetical protein
VLEIFSMKEIFSSIAYDCWLKLYFVAIHINYTQHQFIHSLNLITILRKIIFMIITHFTGILIRFNFLLLSHPHTYFSLATDKRRVPMPVKCNLTSFMKAEWCKQFSFLNIPLKGSLCYQDHEFVIWIIFFFIFEGKMNCQTWRFQAHMNVSQFCYSLRSSFHRDAAHVFNH